MNQNIIEENVAKGPRPCCWCRAMFQPTANDYHPYCPSCAVEVEKVIAKGAEEDAKVDLMQIAKNTIENWHPWMIKAPAGIPLDIESPPCGKCKHWRPRMKTNSKGELDGFVGCTKDDMHHDFSCFIPKAPV